MGHELSSSEAGMCKKHTVSYAGTVNCKLGMCKL
jgi:hypothetical protein